MFRFLTRTPTASRMQKLSQEAKRQRYKAFHDDMAARMGRKIEWAE